MINKLLKNAVVVDVDDSKCIEKAILILKENSESIDDETIIEEANKIIDNYDKKNGGGKKKRWFGK